MVHGHLRYVDEPLDAISYLHKGAEGDQLGDTSINKLSHTVGIGELLPRVRLCGLQRKADPLAVEIDVQHPYRHLVANLDYLARVVHMLPGELRNVDQPVHAPEVDEGAEIDDGRNHAFAHLAGL